MSNNTTKPAPSPMAGKNKPVQWMFAFKFNAASFPGCTDNGQTPVTGSQAIFGGQVQLYKNGHSQQYVFATSDNPALQKGEGCLGATDDDPLGATFGQIYNNPGYYYVLWNDQFYGEPIANLDSPWGHSKGMIAWNDDGEGMVLQVSTPSWPGSGSKADPRQTGNTLGAIGDDDDIEVSQHFFSLQLSKDDVVTVLKGLINASVATDTSQPSIVNNGGPADIQALVAQLGIPASERKEKTPAPPRIPGDPQCEVSILSSRVQFISKPSALHLPPWQLVSAELGGMPLRVACWWASPEIYSTDAGAFIEGWPSSLDAPGAVQIATTGKWGNVTLGLKGGMGTNFNHAKIGVSTNSAQPVCVFGDMNQQGALWTNYAHPGQPMSSSQNGRGGTFYVIQNQKLWESITTLIAGDSAPVKDRPDGAGGTTASTTSKKAVKKTAKKASPKKAAKKAAPKKAAKKSAKKAAKKSGKEKAGKNVPGVGGRKKKTAKKAVKKAAKKVSAAKGKKKAAPKKAAKKSGKKTSRR